MPTFLGSRTIVGPALMMLRQYTVIVKFHKLHSCCSSVRVTYWGSMFWDFFSKKLHKARLFCFACYELCGAFRCSPKKSITSPRTVEKNTVCSFFPRDPFVWHWNQGAVALCVTIAKSEEVLMTTGGIMVVSQLLHLVLYLLHFN